MGYQALLYCTDEKLARVVSQLFSELEFAVTPVNEPFAAVKSLMAQHYDAVVIDCENEQGASLLMKGARNSSFNHGSLAIGLVEGQAGIAKAYRMGANLVLTRPINIEQAKGTLRVARGLLRKGADAAAHSGTAAVPAISSHIPNSAPAPGPHETVLPGHSFPHVSQFEPPVSQAQIPVASVPSSAPAEDVPTLAPPIRVKPWTSLGAPPPAQESQATIPSQPSAQTQPVQVSKAEPPKPAVIPFAKSASKSQGAASAPAPAKEVVTSQPADEEEISQDPILSVSSAPDTAAISASPSFSAVTENASSGSSKKAIIGVVAVILLSAAYFGWTKLGHQPSAPISAPTPAPVAAAPQIPQPAPGLPSTGAPAQSTSLSSAQPAAKSVPSHAISPAESVRPTTTSPGITQPAPAPAQTTESKATESKLAPAPILVKPGSTSFRETKPQVQDDATVAPPPSAAIASSGVESLGGVLSSTAVKPSLARVNVSQGVSQGLLIKRVEPRYPVNALATHTQGTVQIDATIDKEGRVLNPKVLSGSVLLASAALDAVRQWRYKPYLLDGQPVEIHTQITINFKMR